MKARAALFFIAAALGGAAYAQESPSEVTDGEIARYKATAQKGCRDAGMSRGDPQDRVDTFCNCMLQTLEKSMKRTEWQQAYFYAFKNEEARENAVLEPHVKQIAVCQSQ